MSFDVYAKTKSHSLSSISSIGLRVNTGIVDHDIVYRFFVGDIDNPVITFFRSVCNLFAVSSKTSFLHQNSNINAFGLKKPSNAFPIPCADPVIIADIPHKFIKLPSRGFEENFKLFISKIQRLLPIIQRECMASQIFRFNLPDSTNLIAFFSLSNRTQRTSPLISL